MEIIVEQLKTRAAATSGKMVIGLFDVPILHFEVFYYAPFDSLLESTNWALTDCAKLTKLAKEFSCR